MSRTVNFSWIPKAVAVVFVFNLESTLLGTPILDFWSRLQGQLCNNLIGAYVRMAQLDRVVRRTGIA
jgi:hypothetical protein